MCSTRGESSMTWALALMGVEWTLLVVENETSYAIITNIIPSSWCSYLTIGAYHDNQHTSPTWMCLTYLLVKPTSKRMHTRQHLFHLFACLLVCLFVWVCVYVHVHVYVKWGNHSIEFVVRLHVYVTRTTIGGPTQCDISSKLCFWGAPHSC